MFREVLVLVSILFNKETNKLTVKEGKEAENNYGPLGYRQISWSFLQPDRQLEYNLWSVEEDIESTPDLDMLNSDLFIVRKGNPAVIEKSKERTEHQDYKGDKHLQRFSYCFSEKSLDIGRTESSN